MLVERIASKGKDFVSTIYKNVNEFIHALFETLIVMYDPNQDGFLEDLERDLDKVVLKETMDGDIYFVLIVLSRIHNREKDKDLRFKAQALQNVSPIDFGVDTYLLLNEQAPIVNIAR